LASDLTPVRSRLSNCSPERSGAKAQVWQRPTRWLPARRYLPSPPHVPYGPALSGLTAGVLPAYLQKWSRPAQGRRAACPTPAWPAARSLLQVRECPANALANPYGRQHPEAKAG